MTIPKVFVILAALLCFVVAFLGVNVRGLRFEWLGVALVVAAVYL